MSKFSFYGATFILALLILRPAQAATIQWDLDNVHGGGYTVAGFFDTIASTNIITAANITVSNSSGVVFSYVGTSAIETAFDVIFANSILKGIDLFFNPSLLDAGATIQVSVASDYFDFTHPRDSAFLRGDLVGTEISSVPLPSGLPMMLVVMIAFGSFAVRRHFLQIIR